MQNPESSGRSLPFVRKFCLYCGDDILSEQEECEDNRGYHRECISVHIPRCQQAVEAFRVKSRNEHILWIAIHVKYLYGSRKADRNKKDKRSNKVIEFLKKVSAIRNSNSGHLLIHLVGLNPRDNFTGAFDEFADVKLNDLITDGSLFVNVYKKHRLSDYENLKTFSDFLVLYVEGAEYVITSDYKTKVTLDDCITDIKECNLSKLLKKRPTFGEKTFHEIRTEHAEDLCRLKESRHIQTKAYFQPKSRDDNLVHSIFNNLRAAEYISAFSKNELGGSYLLGLVENLRDVEEYGYQTKILTVKAVSLDDRVQVDHLIKQRVSDTCLVCDYDGNEEQNQDLVKIFFIPARDNTGYVIHISVRSVSGIVFYDKLGPEAYRVDTRYPDTNTITRLSVREWFRDYKKQFETMDS